MTKNILFSVVIPVYNSEKSLMELYERLDLTFKKMESEYELIFVNDCSRDNSIEKLREIKSKALINIRIIDLAKNSGQQNALLCGFQYCSGDYIITIDDDLQNPPEEIPKLFNKILEDSDIVYGYYEKKKDKFYKNLGSRVFRQLNHKIFGNKKDIKFSSFRIMKKYIVDEIKNDKTVFPYITGMIVSLTDNIENVIIKHDKRKYGKSNYNLSKLIQLSYNLLINYSSIPLKIVGYFGLVTSFLSFIVGMFFVLRKIINGEAPAGWTSLIVIISFNNSVLLIFLFFIGEYLSRIIKEVSSRKAYSIKEVL